MGLEELFAQWEAAGIFSYALPFLLIFALLFGLLTKLNIFTTKDGEPNKGINVLISLAVSLISLQFNIVSEFFTSLFPRFGIALAVILVILILIGLFTDLENKKMKWIFSAIILIVLVIILWTPLSNLGFNISLNGFFEKNFGIILFAVIIIGVIIWSIVGGKKSSLKSSSAGGEKTITSH